MSYRTKSRRDGRTFGGDKKISWPVFVGGPRQVGKTTLSLGLLGAADETHPAYLSWDVPESQRQRERQARVIQEDLISLDHVKEVSQLQLLAQILPERVGSVLSIANLRQDLSVAAKKERKLYLWDWSLCRARRHASRAMTCSFVSCAIPSAGSSTSWSSKPQAAVAVECAAPLLAHGVNVLAPAFCCKVDG